MRAKIGIDSRDTVHGLSVQLRLHVTTVILPAMKRTWQSIWIHWIPYIQSDYHTAHASLKTVQRGGGRSGRKIGHRYGTSPSLSSQKAKTTLDSTLADSIITIHIGDLLCAFRLHIIREGWGGEIQQHLTPEVRKKRRFMGTDMDWSNSSTSCARKRPDQRPRMWDEGVGWSVISSEQWKRGFSCERSEITWTCSQMPERRLEGKATTGTSPLSWTLSSTEVGYSIALGVGTQDAMWFRKILTFLNGSITPRAWIDNRGASTLSYNPDFRKRTKHIRRRYHVVR